MAKAKYQNVRRQIANILCDEDLAKVEAAFTPTPTVTPSIAISPTVTTISGTATTQLSATVEPSGTIVTWSSSDETKATVSDAGLVTGVSAGTATITGAIEVDGKTYTSTCVVTVE